MPTTTKTKAKKTADRKTRRAQSAKPARSEPAVNALELLETDHREVEELFDEFDELKDDGKKEELARRICMSLTVHTQIEEEIFYPAVRDAIDDDDLLDEAVVEHASAKRLIAEIEEMDAGDELFDAKVRVLGEQVKHHVREEEEELFPEIERSEVDLDALGSQMAKRKQELLKEEQAA